LGHIEQFNKALHPKHTGILHFIKAQKVVEPKVYHLKNGKGEVISDLWEDIKGSINQLPIPLMERIVLLCTQEGDTILDCFMGSGSTGVAAKQLGRNYLGFELADSQTKIAEERIKKAQASKFKDVWVSKQDEIILSIQSTDYEKIKNDLSSPS
jgi:site-specific DNA-methyltransferase (adenine-specific)